MATTRAQFWESLVTLLEQINEYGIPHLAAFLWGAVFLAAMFKRKHYIEYVFASYISIDYATGQALWAVLAPMPSIAYCPNAQYFASFFASLITHLISKNDFPPGLFASFFFALSIIAGICSYPTHLCASVGGTFIAFVVGSIIGILRISFYIDLSHSQIHDNSKTQL